MDPEQARLALQDLRAQVTQLNAQVSRLNRVIEALLPELGLAKSALTEIDQAVNAPDRMSAGQEALKNGVAKARERASS
jgi:prefoldin subunit 5